MEPNKLENQIKEQLNAREIQPSAMAWDRLDSMLSVAEEKKAKRSPFFSTQLIGIAASILVFLSVGIVYFNQKSIEIKPEETIVVKEKVNNNNGNDNSNRNGNKTSGVKVESQVASSNIQHPTSNIQQKSSKGFNHNQSNSNQENQKTTLNSVNVKEEIIQLKSSEVIAQKEDFNNNEKVKQSSLEKVSSSKQIYVDVNELLASAEKQTKKEKISVKVDPTSLLSEIDGELEQTFREKVISKIGKSYQSAKVALANRNQESKINH